MKPAISVILLTTLIGAGQGLFFAFFSVETFALMQLMPDPVIDQSLNAALISIALLVAGLIASFFHLGHPERAWRAAAMWRTSWLSREVICLPVVMGLVAAYWLLQFFNLDSVIFILPNAFPVMLSTLIGFLAACAVFVLFVCTAMIYTCLKFLRQWHHPLTVVNFTFMGLASGFTLAALVSASGSGDYFHYFANTAITLTIIALLTRFLSMQRNRNLRSPSSLQSAIGIHHPNIRQLAQGAMGGSFNTRAFIHQYGGAVVLLARRFLLLSGFVLPVILLLLSDEPSVIFCGFAFVLQMAGFMVERWYFFIEAEHPQNIYYQMIS